MEWALGVTNNFPENNCCACGKDKEDAVGQSQDNVDLTQKFIYQMYNVNSMDIMEQSYNMDQVKNTPRKGIYSNDDQGYKTFNNAQ